MQMPLSRPPSNRASCLPPSHRSRVSLKANFRLRSLMFTAADRERVSKRVLEIAAEDPRVVAGAVVGSLAFSEGDRWSDLDLTFAVADKVSMTDVLSDWTEKMVSEFDAALLFDLVAGASTYRVFLLPGCLQFDLSF